MSTYYLFNECKNLITLCPLKLYEYHDYGSIEICTKSLTWKLFLFFSQCKENSIYKYDLIKTTKNIFRNNICAKSKGKDCTYRISNFTIHLDNKIHIYTEGKIIHSWWYQNKSIKYQINHWNEKCLSTIGLLWYIMAIIKEYMQKCHVSFHFDSSFILK